MHRLLEDLTFLSVRYANLLDELELLVGSTYGKTETTDKFAREFSSLSDKSQEVAMLICDLISVDYAENRRECVHRINAQEKDIAMIVQLSKVLTEESGKIIVDTDIAKTDIRHSVERLLQLVLGGRIGI